MPKNPKIRANYKSDAQYFRRLSHAIEFDPTKPTWWKQDVIAQINHLADMFMEAPSGEEVSQEKAVQEAKEASETPNQESLREKTQTTQEGRR